MTLEDHIDLHGEVPTLEFEGLRQVVKEQELVAIPFYFSVGLARQDFEDVTFSAACKVPPILGQELTWLVSIL